MMMRTLFYLTWPTSAADAIQMHLDEFEFHNPQLAWTDEPQPIAKNFTLRGLDDQRF